LAAIDAWIAGGAKPGTEACGGDGSGTRNDPPPLPCTPDQTLRPKTPGTIAQDVTDQYLCYGVDINVTSARHVIATAPHLDNKAILHHLLLFQTDKAESPNPTPCNAGGSVGWRLFGGWAPGGGNVILPPEAGVRESGTTHWVVQVHYNNAKALANQSDSSGF